MIYKGQPVEFKMLFFDEDNQPADPTEVTLTILWPTDDTPVVFSKSGSSLTNEAVGDYRKIQRPSEPGRVEYWWEGTGGIEQSDYGAFDVVDTPFGDVGVRRPLWLPLVDDVGELLRARTKDDQGNELGTFTDSTRPTKTEVEGYILKAAADLTSCAGDWLPETLYQTSRRVIATRAAMLVEISYWPEQINEDQSAYNQLKALFDEESGDLCRMAAEFRPDEIPGETYGSDGELPIYCFGDGEGRVVIPSEYPYYDVASQTWFVIRDGKIIAYETI